MHVEAKMAGAFENRKSFIARLTGKEIGSKALKSVSPVQRLGQTFKELGATKLHVGPWALTSSPQIRPYMEIKLLGSWEPDFAY